MSLILRFSSSVRRASPPPFNQQKYELKYNKPQASDVLTCYLLQCNEPPWTSYFVKYNSVKDDQWGLSHFNWKAGKSNYHVLRTGCYPFIKYHCSKRPHQDLSLENSLMRIIKIVNLCEYYICHYYSIDFYDDKANKEKVQTGFHPTGIPCLLYGLAATHLIRHTEVVITPHGPINIYFLYEEDKGSQY